MSRTVITSSIITAFVLVACGGSSVVVGNKTDTSGQTLQTTKDGKATGDGATCSWANTTVYEQYGNGATVPTYKLGDEFKSIDGCNECTCAAKGIMCTVNKCQPQACDDIAKVCSDGTSVGRTGPNCAFAACPGEVACTADVKKCPDGSYVARVAPSCAFKECGGVPDDHPCPALAMICPDGTSVGPSGPNCDFSCPPVTCEGIEKNGSDQLRQSIAQYQDCTQDSDCTYVAVASDCFDQCAIVMAKKGQDNYQQTLDRINSSICPSGKAQGCTVEHPACAPSPPPTCKNNKCQ